MRLITTSEELKIAIGELELQQAGELVLLKEQFQKTKEGLKPINIIKSTFKEATANSDLKADVLNAAIGLTSGVLAKKMMIGKTINPIKKLLGLVVEMVVSSKVAKNADGIKSVGTGIFNLLFGKKQAQDKA